MVYNMGISFVPFVTVNAFDRRTDGQSGQTVFSWLTPPCICSLVKIAGLKQTVTVWSLIIEVYTRVFLHCISRDVITLKTAPIVTAVRACVKLSMLCHAAGVHCAPRCYSPLNNWRRQSAFDRWHARSMCAVAGCESVYGQRKEQAVRVYECVDCGTHWCVWKDRGVACVGQNLPFRIGSEQQRGVKDRYSAGVDWLIYITKHWRFINDLWRRISDATSNKLSPFCCNVL